MLPTRPPLDPSGAEGRRLLRDELTHNEYHHDLARRVLDWLWRRVQGGAGAASGTHGVAAFVTLLLAALLVVGLAVLLTRVRRDRRERTRSAVVLTASRVSAAELRRLAEGALADGRYAASVTDAFRALAVRQVERGRLADQPGATAHEVATSLAATYPAHGERVGRTADLFDATLYGDRPADRVDAVGVLELDDTLAGVR